MFASIETASGLVAPLKINQFELQRRYLAWKKKREKEIALEKLHDTDTRRALFILRNHGAEGLIRMDAESRERRARAEEEEANRIAKMMAIEAADFLYKRQII